MLSPLDILACKILIVDDQAVNILLLERMLQGAGYTAVTTTMEATEVGALHQRHQYDLILLDLHMPHLDGFEVLAALQALDPDGYPPVIVITAQPNQKLRALQAGAKDFIAKPFELAEVLARVHNLLEVRQLHKRLHDYNELLEQRLRERTADLQESYLEAIFAISRAVDNKDEGVGAHAQRISLYSRALARMLGLDAVFVDHIFVASPMHDVGKIGVPDAILLKPGALTAEEWVIMRRHAAMGAQILGNSKSAYLTMGAEIALNHHERWDGSGYPAGKQGEAIPLAARIMLICDIYDALRSRRPYKPAFDHVKTMDIIMHGDGRTMPAHFDPAILAVLQEHHLAFADIFAECAV